MNFEDEKAEALRQEYLALQQEFGVGENDRKVMYNPSKPEKKKAVKKVKEAPAMSMQDYYQARLGFATMQEIQKDPETIKVLDKEISNKRKELAKLKTQRYIRNVGGFVAGASKKVDKVVDKITNSRLKYKSAVKKSPRATVDVSQKVYTKDRSRFFNNNFEQERRQLFFS